MSRVGRRTLLSLVMVGLSGPLVGMAQDPPGVEAPIVIAPERSPLLKEPTTPEETFEAVVLLVDLARFDLAGDYLKQFVAGNPSEALLQSLRDKYGTATFVRLTRIPELKTDAEPLLQRLNTASRQQAQDPAYIDTLLDRLDGSPLQRELAIRDLRNAGVEAVPQILKRMATTKLPTERDLLVIALTRMGQPVIPAVLAGLESPNTTVRNGCIEVLALLNSQEAVPRLWPLALAEDVDAGTQLSARRAIAKIRFGSSDNVDRLSDSLAIQELDAMATARLTNSVQSPVTEPGQETVVRWQWDPAINTVKSTSMPAQQAILQDAATDARSAFLLNSERDRAQTLYLLAELAVEVQRVGWDQVLTAESSPAMQAAVSSGIEPLQRVLHTAMEMGRTDAVWGALQGLSAAASPELVRSGVSPVLKALNYPDPRVQFAAAVTAIRSRPELDFPGATRVVEILRRALNSVEGTRAVIINPDAAEAAVLGTYVFQNGFLPEVAATGREGFRVSASGTGVQLIVVHANVANWGLTQTLTNLRADSRTAYLPIVVYGPERVRGETARLVSRTKNAVFAAESPAAESFWQQVTPHLKAQAAPPPSAQQREDFKSLAVYWLAELITRDSIPRSEHAAISQDLLPLLSDEAVAQNVVTALGQMGTAEVQSRLSEAALNQQLPIAIRRSSARELAMHIPRFGLLIEKSMVADLTNGWGMASDGELRAHLAAVVGSFKPNAGLVGERLRQLSAP